jgi:hypothetical protein
MTVLSVLRRRNINPPEPKRKRPVAPNLQTLNLNKSGVIPDNFLFVLQGRTKEN